MSHSDVRGHDHEEETEQLGLVERGRRRELDGVTERLEQARGVLGCGDALRIGLGHRGRRRGAEPDAQPARVGADLVDVRARRWRRRVRVAGHRALDRVEHGGAVAHGPREHVALHEPGPRLTDLGTERDPTTGGLEPEEAARARGDADRSSAVARVADRHHARRHRRGRSRRSNLRCRGRCSTGCASGRTRRARWSASARTPVCSSCRPARTPRRAAS